MASIIMHMAIADQLYKKIKSRIKIDYNEYMLGTIAPDISKQIGESKMKSHFMKNEYSIPNVNEFLEKYINTLNNSFNLGYFIHLYTDRLFYRDYYPLFIQGDFFSSIIRRLDGNFIKIDTDGRTKMLYNDYTNLNHLLIDEYKLNLDLFYNDFVLPQTNIDEIDVDKLNVLIEGTGIILQNLNKEKEYIIEISSIKSFIDDCIEEIYDKLLSLNII